MGQITVGRTRSGLGGGQALPPGARLIERAAKPLSGKEIKEALEAHSLYLLEKVFEGIELTDEQAGVVKEEMIEDLRSSLGKVQELGKIHLVYPRVCWRIRVYLHKLSDEEKEGAYRYLAWVDIQLDLERNNQKNIVAGNPSLGKEVAMEEDEQLQTRVPDEIRGERGLKVEAEYVLPTGEMGKVEIDVEGKRARKVEALYTRQRPLEREVEPGGHLAPKLGDEQEIVGPSDIPIEVQRASNGAIEALEKELAQRRGEIDITTLPVARTEEIRPKATELPIEDLIGQTPSAAKQEKPKSIIARRVDSKRGIGGGR